MPASRRPPFRRGWARTALVSFDPETIGAMSCNPAIGGLGKGHLVREVDAFDGLIARAADAAAIHYRMLNRSKGSAVQGPRVQADRKLFRAAIQRMIAAQPNLTVVAGEAAALRMQGGRVVGIDLGNGDALAADAVVLCTGTFLGGRLFRGEERMDGGRIGESAAHRLATQLRDADLPMARLKTGTPPRLDGRTIDWARLPEQPSDAVDDVSADAGAHGAAGVLRDRAHQCAHARYHPSGLDRSPLFTGAIGAQGRAIARRSRTRSTASAIATGTRSFSNRRAGRPHGLPERGQHLAADGCAGGDDAQHRRAGAGGDHRARLCGGIRSHRSARAAAQPGSEGHPGALLRRADQRDDRIRGGGGAGAGGRDARGGGRAGPRAGGAGPGVELHGVMIDDLTLHGVSEPYRMLTARAEYRLRLRANNASTRLTPLALAAGVGNERAVWFEARRNSGNGWSALAADATPTELARAGMAVRADGTRRSLMEWLRFPEVTLAALQPWMGDGAFDPLLVEEVEEDAAYAPYLARQDAELRELRSSDAVALGDDFPSPRCPAFPNEMVERLQRARPDTLAAAGRIAGITPAALASLLVHARRRAA
jgi:tRNA uridine 5-carboxymethylaminomethyl modification enzyme